MAELEFSPDDVSPVNQVQRPFKGTVTVKSTSTGQVARDFDPDTVQPAARADDTGTAPEAPKRTPVQALLHEHGLGARSAIDSVLETAGIPGSINRAGIIPKVDEAIGDRTAAKVPVIQGISPAQIVHAAHLLDKHVLSHLPSGEDIKDTFWGAVKKATGIEPAEPENLTERMVSEGIKAAVPVPSKKAELGVRGTQFLAGALGEVAANMSKDHPELARFITQIGTGFGVHGAAALAKGTTRTIGDVAALRTAGGQQDAAARALLAAHGSDDAARLAREIGAGNTELVAGSRPTTAQAAGSANLTAATENAKVGNPAFAAQVAERATEQNQARRAAAGAIEPGGNPEDVRAHLQGIQDNAKARVDQIEQAAAADVQKKVEALGAHGTYDNDTLGRTIREAAHQGYTTAQEEVSHAYNNVLGPGRSKQVSIDPTPAINRITNMMRKHYGRMNQPPREIAELVGDISEAKGLNYKDMNDLITRTSGLIGQMKDGNAKAALINIKQILLERMDASASNSAKHLPYTNNAEAEARTIRERVVRLNEIRDVLGQKPLSRWAASREALEKQIATAEKEARVQTGTEGDLNPQEWARYQHARTMRDEVDRRYGQGAMGRVLQRGMEQGRYATADSNVPGQFFHSRATAPEDIRQFEGTMGGRHNAMASLQEYASGHLLATIEKNGGKVTPELMNKWMTAHGASLRPYPELRRQIEGIKSAADAQALAGTTERQTLEDYQKSAARHFINKDNAAHPVDVDAAIGNALKPSNRFSGSDVRQLAKLAATDTTGDATAGLRRGIVDHAMRQAGLSTLDTHGDQVLGSTKFNKWLRDNREKIAPAFEPGHLEALEKIGQDLERGTLGAGAAGGGAVTIGNAIQTALHGGTLPRALMNTPLIKKVAEAVMSRSRGEIQDAYNRMLLDPAAARAALEKISGPKAAGAVEVLFSHLAKGSIAIAVRTGAHINDVQVDHGQKDDRQGFMAALTPDSVAHFRKINKLINPDAFGEAVRDMPKSQNVDDRRGQVHGRRKFNDVNDDNELARLVWL